MHKQRLLNVAIALEDAHKDEHLRAKFSMFTFVHNRKGDDCGTPACAIGHYAARADLQDVLTISDVAGYMTVHDVVNTDAEPVWDEEDHGGPKEWKIPIDGFDVADHFDITGAQCQELFGSEGCNHAITPLAAADYIRDFVEEYS